jgi:hypothetical protein
MDPSPSQNARTPKKSLFSRKPVRRSSTDARPHSPPTNSLPSDHPSTRDSPAGPLNPPTLVSREPSLDPLSPNPSRSIIPESIKELPSWYNTESELAAATTRQFRGRYPIHNPVGPRFYRNVHLLPPTRPASVFSPSFPPMSADPALTTSPSRTPSGSPLPTPSSSQTRIPDPSGKLRTRKISNAAPDTVDLLDASDPYGTNWHHESPYDGLGLSGDRTAVTPDGPDVRDFNYFVTCTKEMVLDATPPTEPFAHVHSWPGHTSQNHYAVTLISIHFCGTTPPYRAGCISPYSQNHQATQAFRRHLWFLSFNPSLSTHPRYRFFHRSIHPDCNEQTFQATKYNEISLDVFHPSHHLKRLYRSLREEAETFFHVWSVCPPFQYRATCDTWAIPSSQHRHDP